MYHHVPVFRKPCKASPYAFKPYRDSARNKIWQAAIWVANSSLNCRSIKCVLVVFSCITLGKKHIVLNPCAPRLCDCDLSGAFSVPFGALAVHNSEQEGSQTVGFGVQCLLFESHHTLRWRWHPCCSRQICLKTTVFVPNCWCRRRPWDNLFKRFIQNNQLNTCHNWVVDRMCIL